MKKLSIVTLTLAALVFALNANVSYAGCGACGSGGKTSAHTHGKLESSAMPCGCPASDKSMGMHQKMNVVKMAEHAGSFNTLLTAVKAAGLEETLMGEGPYTVFAPTDEAFANLPDGTLDKLLKDKEQLRAVLTYHVHPGKASSSDVMKMKSLKTVNGQKAKVAVEADGVMIDQATVTSTDIHCSNGVIHIIDKVMLPKVKTS